MMNFYDAGQMLRITRERAGLTQTQLAKQLGMGRAVISRVENGMFGDFSIRKYERISNLLGLTLTVGSFPPLPTLDDVMDENGRLHEQTHPPDKIPWTRCEVSLDERQLRALLANGEKASKALRSMAVAEEG
jgi:transcriptional regulator with XRE-family HTH domain